MYDISVCVNYTGQQNIVEIFKRLSSCVVLKIEKKLFDRLTNSIIFNTGSSIGDFWIYIVDNGHPIEAISVKLIVVYSVCFTPSMDVFNSTFK